jgi:UDP-2,3-diacylglucosamine pyrophosphatase LpxH
MQFSFDLISDLHVDSVDQFVWSGQPTSTTCIVAGDVGRNRTKTLEALQHLAQCYQAVFYIDGNDEHANQIEFLETSYLELNEQLSKIPRLVYLLDNVVVIDGVAVVATNGWWSYDFDPNIDYDITKEWYAHKKNLTDYAATNIQMFALNDAAYLINSVKRLQTHQDVKRIVIVTHTVPLPSLIDHDPELIDTAQFNIMGNRYMQQVLDVDTEQKIHTWCFGHYHNSVDQIYNNVRYVNNCLGYSNTPYVKSVYYPKRIVIDT